MRHNLASIFALRSFTILGLCLIALQIPAPAQQNQTAATSPAQQVNLEMLDIPALIRASDRNGAAMHRRLLEFTYIQRRISREVGPNGKVIEQVREFEAYPIKTAGHHQHILSLIKKDGVSVSRVQLERNRQFAASEMEKAERGETAPTADAETTGEEKYITAGIGIGPAGEGVWLGVSQFLRQCRFEAPRTAQLGDREMIALTLHSCAANLAEPRESYLAKLTGIVWIDAADKVVLRLEAWPIAPISGAERPKDILAERPSAEVIVYEQQRIRVGTEGEIWAPRRIRLDGIGKAMLFNGVHKDMSFEFTDYRHFSTDIKEKEIIEPKKEPVSFSGKACWLCAI
jgi:hypothetical protein